MQQDEKRQKQKKHQRLMQKIKKQVFTEDIQNVRVSYSELVKKSATGFSKNNRLFFLFHKDKIGYLNQLQKGVLLPYQTLPNLPKKLKAQVKLDNVIKVKSEKGAVITIQFKNGQKNQQWQFIAASPQMAKIWQKMIKASSKQLKQDIVNPPRDIVVQSKQPNKKQGEKSDNLSQNRGSKNPSQSNTNKKIEQLNKSDGKHPLQSQNKNIKSTQQQQNKSPQQNIYAENPNFGRKQGEKKLGSEQKLNEQQNRKPQLQHNQNQNQNQNDSGIPVFGPKIIQKPKSTLFVGGIAVDNQKDQQELKNKMQSFQSLTAKMKQQYDKKRKQQKRIQQQVNLEHSQQSTTFNPVVLGQNLLSFSTNIKYQIEKMQRQWGYQFAKSQNQYEIVGKFKEYVEAVTRKIVDQLGLEEKKRYYQPQDVTNTRMKYEINGVLFQIYMAQLKEIGNSNSYNSYGEKGTIVSNAQQKMAAHQFKNYDYILRLTQNKGKIRVPLSMMTHYKGFSIFAKVLVPSTQTYQKMDLLQKQLQILEAQSRINNSIFQDPDPETGRIVALQSKAYQKLARAENSPKKFDLCFIEDLHFYLPHDFYSFSKQRPYQRLRYQLIQDQQHEDRILHGEDMCAIANRLKLPQDLRDGINQLTEISKGIQRRVVGLVECLENLEEYFTNSHELSQLMHKNGVNMRYLGMVIQRCKQNWLKQIILAQITARCAKKYLYFDLQNCILNLSQSSMQNIQRFQYNQLIKFLNKLLSNSQQTQMFWKLINRQAQTEYKVSVNRQQINQRFLMQALQYHCCFKFKDNIGQFGRNNKTSPNRGGADREEKFDGQKSVASGVSLGGFAGLTGLSKKGSKMGLGTIGNSPSSINANENRTLQLFSSPNPFSIDNIACFQHKSKVYNLGFTQFYSSLETLISSQLSLEAFDQLKILLNLSRSQILPPHLKLSPTLHQNLTLYLSNFMSPKQLPSLYYPENQQIQLGQILPSKLLYSIKMIQIKWLIKQGRIEQSERIKDWIIQHISRWIGESQPILTQLYEIYANYYMTKKDQQKKAVNYCKSGIKNQEKLIGQYHQKMADSYYLLGTVYLNYFKKPEAINSFKKASQIILKINAKDSQAYGQVCLKMAQLYLSLNQLQVAVQNGLEAIKILEKFNNQQALMNAIQIVARCYQVGEEWELYMRFIQEVVVKQVGQFVQSVELLQRIIKVCILPSLKIIAQTNTNIAQKILKILSQLPQTTRSPNMALNFLTLRITDNTFPQRFLIALTDIQQILSDIESNGMLARWKGFQNLSNKSLLNKVGVGLDNPGFNFIATLQAVNLFLGSSFIQGVLLDQ